MPGESVARLQPSNLAAFLIDGDGYVVDRIFGFDQLPDALRHMEAGKHFGKIVVEL